MSEPRKPGQRLLHSGYVPALALLVAGPVKWTDLCTALGWSRGTVQRLLHCLHAQGLTYIHSYGISGADRRSRCPIYAFGSEPDAPNPSPPRPRRETRPPPIEALTFCHAIKALMAEPHHGRGLSDATGLSPRTAQQLIRTLRAAGLIYIAEYQPRPTAGNGYPLFSWGPGMPDKRKPAPVSKRKLWVKHNAIRSRRNEQAKLLRLMVTGTTRRRPVVDATA